VAVVSGIEGPSWGLHQTTRNAGGSYNVKRILEKRGLAIWLSAVSNPST
jgi:hypothetical protein